MPVYKLHRYLFFGMIATIALLLVQLFITSTRLNHVEELLHAIEMSRNDERAIRQPGIDDRPLTDIGRYMEQLPAKGEVEPAPRSLNYVPPR